MALANRTSRASRYLTRALVRSMSLEVTTTSVQKSLVTVMVLQSFGDVVVLTHIGHPAAPVRAVTEQDVDTGALSLRPAPHLAQFVPAAFQHVPGPVHDLGCDQSSSRSVDQEHAYLLSLSGSSPSRM